MDMRHPNRQFIPTIPYSDSEPTLDMTVGDAHASDDIERIILEEFDDRVVKMAERLDGGASVAELDIGNPDHRAAILLHIQDARPDYLR